jgi:hypothetical protein
LIIERSYRSRITLNPTFIDILTYPLYFDRGTNCIHIGAADRSLGDLGLRIPGVGMEMEETSREPRATPIKEEPASSTHHMGISPQVGYEPVNNNSQRGISSVDRKRKPSGSVRDIQIDPVAVKRRLE